jgi:diguanylate cyclase (GGDEF)-like protein
MVDLDHFKNVNDNHGHFAGDAVLCESARRMQGTIRQYDAIGRYGGEEFLVMLPGCDEQGCFNLAERMRKQLSQAQMSLTENAINVTASFGATVAVPGQVWTVESLIRKADEALYLAKRLGRNRVEVLPIESPPAAAIVSQPETEPVAQ